MRAITTVPGIRAVIGPPLLRRRSNDEVPPLPLDAPTARARERMRVMVPDLAARLGASARAYTESRLGTAATLRAIDAEHGGGFYAVDEEAVADPDAADACFDGDEPVVDVQTHLVDATRWVGSHAEALEMFLRLGDPERWGAGIDPRAIDGAAWASLVFGSSETAVALLTSTPGVQERNVLTNPQIAAARDLVERYDGTGRVLTHTIVHPNVGSRELDAMRDWQDQLRPSAWKCYTLYGPPTAAAPEGGWFLDDEEVGAPFLERVRDLGPRIVATHKGLGGPVPDASLASASPRDVGPAAAAFPDIDFVVYHSGYERNPDAQEGAFDPAAPGPGVDRLVASVREAGITHKGNVYAELGTTWFLMLRRPLEAAHVLGKLLLALGPERILWGTDSVWYGSPQPLIDAFRAFQIPERLQEAHGYPALSAEVKERILSRNARALYAIDDAALAPGRVGRDVWSSEIAPAVRSAVEATTA
jgi:uncharacterized protein